MTNDRPAAKDYVLYYAPGAASFAVHWALNEIGVPFVSVRLDLKKREQDEPQYRAINPAGRVPTLLVDSLPLGESAGLLMLLAERHPSARLAPTQGQPARGIWLEMMIWLANGLLPPMRDWFYAEQDGAVDPAAARAFAQRRIEGCWEKLSATLAAQEYVAAPSLSVADFLATMLMRWSRNMPKPATDWPSIHQYVRRMRARPAFVRTCDLEGLDDWRNDR